MRHLLAYASRSVRLLNRITSLLSMSLNEQTKKWALLMTPLKVAANCSLKFLLFQSGRRVGDRGECLKLLSALYPSRTTMEDVLSREEANSRTHRTHIRCLEHSEPAARDPVWCPLAGWVQRLFVWTTWISSWPIITSLPHTTWFLSNLSRASWKGPAVDSAPNTNCDNGDRALQPVTLTTAGAIAVVDNVAYAPRKFGALPKL